MAFVQFSSLAGASAATCACPVPAGAASGHIAVVGIYKENGAAITTVPTGFTNKAALVTSATLRGELHVYWKRLSAADSGIYTFSWTGSTFRAAACALYSGRITTGDPFDGTPGTNESTTSVTTLNVAATPTTALGDAVGFWTNFTGSGTWSPNASYTERVDIPVITLDTRDAIAAGATGNVTATTTASGFIKAFLGVLAPDPGGAPALPPELVMAARQF